MEKTERKDTQRAIPEFVGMAALVLAMGCIISPSDPFLLDVQPHPFWAIVLLVAVRYGSPAGPVAGISCAVLHVLGLWVVGVRPADLLQMGSTEIVVPLLYVVIGAIVGDTVESHMRRGDYLKGQLKELRDRLNYSESRRTELELAYQQVESRVAGNTDTLLSFYDGLMRMTSTDRREVYRALVELIKRQHRADRCGVWLRQADGSFRREYPEPASDEPVPTVGQVALEEGGVVTAAGLFGQDEDEVDPEAGLMAGLISAGDGEVRAVAVVQSMQFIGYTPTTVKLFGQLLDVASRSVSRATALENAQRSRVEDPSLQVSSEVYLRTRARQELSLAERRGTPASLMLCGLPGGLPASVRNRLIAALAEIVRNQTRSSDTVAYLGDEAALAVFMPDTDGDGCRIVMERLQKRVEWFDFRPPDQTEPLTFGWGRAERNGSAEFDDMLERAIVSMQEGRQ